MSKGSAPRPLSVKLEEFDKKFDSIFGSKPRKEQYVPPPIPEVKVEKKKIEWSSSDNYNKD